MKKIHDSQEIKMIDFIDQIYKKYKVLTKLNYQQSNDFQNQVIQLLTDENQNINKQTYQTVVQKIGLPNFILEILSKIINHSKFDNQYQLKKNINEIADEFQNKQKQLNKKIKIIERKQNKIKIIQNQLSQRIKQFSNKIQKEIISRLNEKENDLKKRINGIFYQLKNREKILNDKVEQMKLMKKKLVDMENKEKIIQQKYKNLQKKERQLKLKQNQLLTANCKSLQIQAIKKSNESIKLENKQLIKKIKNSDLAYKKIKSEIQSKDIKIKQIEILLKKSHEKLQKQKNKQKNCQSNKFNISQIQKIQNNDNSNILQFLSQPIQQIDQFFHIIQQLITLASLDNQQFKPNILIKIETIYSKYNKKLTIKKKNNRTFQLKDNINQKIQCQSNFVFQLEQSKINFEDDENKIQLINSNVIQSLIKNCIQCQYNRNSILQILQLTISAIQQGKYYQKIIDYLSQEQVTNFLQQCFLRYQMNTDIAQQTTIILCRISMSRHKFKMLPQFSKAISIRNKMDQKNEGILSSNIKYLCLLIE